MNRRRAWSSRRPVAAGAIVCLLVAGVAATAGRAHAADETTLRASVGSSGEQGNEESYDPHVSADGRLVVFESDASNLVTGDTNGRRDIFVRDLVTGTTTRVSVGPGGVQGDGDSGPDPIISADGRFVAFPSYAKNLVSLDTNGKRDLFVRDLAAGTTSRVSVSTSGAQGTGPSFDPYVSGDGRYVSFSSGASNLVASDTNGVTDVFVRDTVAMTTIRVSVPSSGGQANGASEDAVISDDGRFVAYSSVASNLVAGDTNSERDTFVRDVVAGTTTRANTSSSGAQANGSSGYNPAISGDGRFVAFNDDSSNLVPVDTNGRRDVFVRELATGTVERVDVSTSGSQANGSSTSAPSISRDGRYVAFLSGATNLVPGDTNGKRDVFLHDREAQVTARVSVTATGGQASGGDCFSQPYVNQSANLVVFTCGATNLVAGDTNGVYDVFVRTLPSSSPPPPPSDSSPPSVAVTDPVAGATVTGTVPVTIAASDDAGVTRVDLTVDGSVVATDAAAPWAFDWNTGPVSSGAHVLAARAYDAAGNGANSPDVPVVVSNSRPATLVFTPSADTTVRDDYPGTNYGSTKKLSADAGPLKRALLRFTVAGLDGRQVQRATLRLFGVDASGVGGDVHRVGDASWAETTTTWSNAPAYDAGVVGSIGAVTVGSWYEVDVTSLVAADGSVDIAIVSGSTNGVDYASREQADFAPQLVVTAAA